MVVQLPATAAGLSAAKRDQRPEAQTPGAQTDIIEQWSLLFAPWLRR